MSNEYEYSIGTGGCSRCQAMVGLYPQEPPRPHDYCDCIITPARSRDFDWSYEIVKWYWATGASGEEYISGVDYEVKVTCRDTGEKHEETFYLAQTEEESNDGETDLPQIAYGKASFMYQNYCIGIV